MIILDTNHLTVLQQGGLRAEALDKRLAAAEATHILAVTIVTVEEVVQGWLNKIHQAPTNGLAVPAYEHLHRFLASLNNWLILPFDSTVAARTDALRQAGIRRVGLKDLRIAATALTHEAVLLSANLRDFRQVPELRVEDWLA